jgi:hypothetical protein
VCSKGMDKKKRSASTAGSLRPAMRRTPAVTSCHDYQTGVVPQTSCSPLPVSKCGSFISTSSPMDRLIASGMLWACILFGAGFEILSCWKRLGRLEGYANSVCSVLRGECRTKQNHYCKYRQTLTNMCQNVL